MASSDPSTTKPHHPHPFRRAVLRGLGVLLPPLLTIVIFVWIGSTVKVYVLQPVQAGAREILVWSIQDVEKRKPGEDPPEAKDGVEYKALPHPKGANQEFVPEPVYMKVASSLVDKGMPTRGKEVYRQYVDEKYLQAQVVIPLFACAFILVMYLLGKTIAAGVGGFVLDSGERVIKRLPIIRNVYSSVKQVTDFIFSERQVEYTRVVAIEYPRKGIWSLGMVTGESMIDIESAANEPVLSILMPTSPMPMTGFTLTVKKSETIDVNLSIDQAIQFIVSCGVVVPPQQMRKIAADSDPALTSTFSDDSETLDSDKSVSDNSDLPGDES